MLSIRKSPATDLAGPLMWTRTGTVWATWRLDPLAYNRPIEDKVVVSNLHRALVRVLSGEGLLHSMIVPTDAAGLVNSMMEGIDLAHTPGWAAECEATLDVLDELPLGQRYYWLSLPLSNLGGARWSAPAQAAVNNTMELAGLGRPRPQRAEIQARLAQVAALQEVLPGPFRPTPVSVAEQVWIHSHAQHRGMAELPLPGPGDQEILNTAASMSEPLMDPGARTDDKPPTRTDLLGQRVLKVLDPAGADIHQLPPSYQCMLAMAEPPAGGLAFPGSELFQQLDSCGLDVDWAIRLRINSRRDVLARNRSTARRLNEQYDQRSAEVSSGLHDLDHAAKVLAEYDQAMAADTSEVEVDHTVILSVATCAQDAEEPDHQVRIRALQQAQNLQKWIYDNAGGIKFERLPGTDEPLWWSMLPGPANKKLMAHWAQYTTSADFSRLVPVITNQLGSGSGVLMALDTAPARPRPVLNDLNGLPDLDVSGSFLAAGEMGAGKSFFQKTQASHLVDQGGQFFVIDKSEQGEWVPMARAIGTHQIVDPLEPTVSMDPLRLIGGTDGCDLARSTLTVLLNLDTQGSAGRTLARVLSLRYLQEHGLGSLAEVAEHLSNGDCLLEGAAELADLLVTWLETPIARVLFDDTLPPADLTVQATVWRTHGMEQPTAEQLSQAHLYRQLPLATIFGRAYYRLLCGLARALCFADPTRTAAFIVDEAYDATQSPENVADMQHFLRRGRRGRALLWIGTHDPHDTNDEVLAGLIPTRLIFRHRDEVLAARGLRYLGITEKDPKFDTYLKDLTTNTSPLMPGGGGVPPERRGEAYMRDAMGNFGKVTILGPAQRSRRAAVNSTPPKRATQAA